MSPRWLIDRTPLHGTEYALILIESFFLVELARWCAYLSHLFSEEYLMMSAAAAFVALFVSPLVRRSDQAQIPEMPVAWR